LFDGEKKIAFNFTVEKDYTVSKEAVYIAFPVAAKEPHFTYEIQQGWVDPAVDLMRGGSSEWFSVQHWMAVNDDTMATAIVPIDAPLATFGDIVRGEWPGVFVPKSPSIFSYVMNNYWGGNYVAGQGGVFKFRYVMTTTARLAPAAFSKLGWESMEPVEVNRVIVPDKIGDPERPLPASGTSLLEVSGKHVILAEWKPAEDGKGSIVRLQETGGNAAEATVKVRGSSLRTAALCDAVEDDQHALEVRDGAVRMHLKPHEVVTLRLNTD
jgi:alpha-mannosidase